jgi:hypothetical protein
MAGTMNDYHKQKRALEDAFVNKMLLDYDIREVTTQRQAKNDTRAFEFPVSSLSPKTRYGNVKPNDFPKLRMAVYKSGMVRKLNGAWCPYPVNRRYSRLHKYTVMINGELTSRQYMTMAYETHMNIMVSLNYMLNYYLKNYAK